MTLSGGFSELQTHHKANISQLVSASMELIKQNLQSYARILRTDNDLAGAYLLAIESQDESLIKDRLTRIKTDVGFNEVNIFSPQYLPINSSALKIPAQIIKTVLGADESKYLVLETDGRLTMISLSPLMLYEKTVGVILLAKNLDALIDAQVSQNTNSKVTLRLVNGSRSHVEIGSDYPVLYTPDWSVYANIELKGNNYEIASVMSYRLVWVGALSIIVLAVMFYIFLEIGFIRQFMTILTSIDEYTSNLSLGKLSSLNLKVKGLSETQLLSKSFLKLTDSLFKYQNEVAAKKSIEAEALRQKAIAELARQVAHDIRSPLSALGVLLHKTQELPEESRVLARMAITRITDIANNLLTQNMAPSNASSKNRVAKHLISNIINEVVSEKRIAYRERLAIEINYQADSESFGLFSVFEPVDLKRVLSNLIDNSVEALSDNVGVIDVTLGSTSTGVFIKIRDNGKGIPKDILDKLGQKGFSYGKSEVAGAGSGLGLFHAKKMLGSWGGSLSINSKIKEGTKVLINLPKVEAPEWFAQKLIIHKDGLVVAIDDDNSIHKIWDSRMKDAAFADKILHFSNPAEFRDWRRFAENQSEEIVYLVDYEFVGSDLNGLDLIEMAKISSNAVLVTSHFDDAKIVARAAKLGVKMLPKEAAGLIPISLA